ncbi:MAG: hypothetical protein LBO78_00245 [Rickettsiales bacterium]|nr:hypothetical protein [Rickettsiales bacterium]
MKTHTLIAAIALLTAAPASTQAQKAREAISLDCNAACESAQSHPKLANACKAACEEANECSRSKFCKTKDCMRECTQ